MPLRDPSNPKRPTVDWPEIREVVLLLSDASRLMRVVILFSLLLVRQISWAASPQRPLRQLQASSKPRPPPNSEPSLGTLRLNHRSDRVARRRPEKRLRCWRAPRSKSEIPSRAKACTTHCRRSLPPDAFPIYKPRWIGPTPEVSGSVFYRCQLFRWHGDHRGRFHQPIRESTCQFHPPRTWRTLHPGEA